MPTPGVLLRVLMGVPLLRPILRPATRLIVGLVAVPLFRLFLRRVVRLQRLDEELEKDLEQWFRSSLVLLVATRNMEASLFGWVDELWQGELQWPMMGFRLLLAIGVVQTMPDQDLFAIIHPGPPKLRVRPGRGLLAELRRQFRPIVKGLVCQHLNRSSPVFAILSAIAPGWIGWICYGVAIFQYLVIGLVTSKDRALDVLSEFDRQVALRRRQLVAEFDPDSVVPGESTDSLVIPAAARSVGTAPAPAESQTPLPQEEAGPSGAH